MYGSIMWNNKIFFNIQSTIGKLKNSEFYDVHVEFSYSLEKALNEN